MRIRTSRLDIGRTALSMLALLALMSGVPWAGEPARLQTVDRLVVHYHDGSFELVGRSAVRKVIPPTLEFADSSGNVSGSWFELQSSTGITLYRRPLSPPNIVYVEHLADSTTGRIEREETTISDRTFVVTVPQRNDGARVAIYGFKAGAADKAAASQVLGYIQLR